MPKRDHETNRQRRPRRFSRRVRKTVENAYRRYLGDPRVEVRADVRRYFWSNKFVPLKGVKRSNKISLSFRPYDCVVSVSAAVRIPIFGVFEVQCHGSRMFNRAG